jgi:hypothetical protein
MIHSQQSFGTGCAETLVNNYRSMLRNIQEGRRHQSSYSSTPCSQSNSASELVGQKITNALSVAEEIMLLTKGCFGKSWKESNIVFHVVRT